MMHLTRISVLSLAAGLLTAIPATSATAESLITLGAADLDVSQTRTSGHNDVQRHKVHVYTDSNDSLSKAAAYFDLYAPVNLGDLGQPSMDWSFKFGNGSQPAAPGIQVDTDFDGDGARDAYLVCEPDVYGDSCWAPDNADTAQFVKDGAPACLSGCGSVYSGTIAQWAAAFPSGQALRGGWSLGSGIKGDGFISSMTYGEVTYEFSNLVTPPPVTVTPHVVSNVVASCRQAVIDVTLPELPDGTSYNPSTIKYKVAVGGSTLQKSTFDEGGVYHHVSTFTKASGVVHVKVFEGQGSPNILVSDTTIQRNCN